MIKNFFLLSVLLLSFSSCISRKPAGIAPPSFANRITAPLMAYENWHASCSDEKISPISGFWVGPQIREMTGSHPEYPQLREFYSDGCSIAPNSLPWENKQNSWELCCLDHDVDYWIGGTLEERKVSDENLKSCIARSGSPRIASLYQASVNIFGTPNSAQNFRWGYGWNFKRNYEPLSDREKEVIAKIYKSTPEDLKFWLRDQARPLMLNSCGKFDLIFQGYENSDRVLFSYLNENLYKNDIVDWIRELDFNLEKQVFEIKLRSCADVVVVEVNSRSQVQVKSEISCKNWK